MSLKSGVSGFLPLVPELINSVLVIIECVVCLFGGIVLFRKGSGSEPASFLGISSPFKSLAASAFTAPSSLWGQFTGVQCQ